MQQHAIVVSFTLITALLGTLPLRAVATDEGGATMISYHCQAIPPELYTLDEFLPSTPLSSGQGAFVLPSTPWNKNGGIPNASDVDIRCGVLRGSAVSGRGARAFRLPTGAGEDATQTASWILVGQDNKYAKAVEISAKVVVNATTGGAKLIIWSTGAWYANHASKQTKDLILDEVLALKSHASKKSMPVATSPTASGYGVQGITWWYHSERTPRSPFKMSKSSESAYTAAELDAYVLGARRRMIRYLSDTRVKENGVDNSDTLLKSELNYKYSKMTKSWVSYRDYLLAVENRAEPFRLRGSASETSELHAALRSNLIALATAAKAMELREHPNSTDAKKAVVDAFQVLHAKGLNATSFDPQVEDSRWYTEGRHTLPPETYIWAIRESSAFAMSLLLARDYLSETPQALDDALATLHAHTKQYGADQIHKYMDSYFGTISGMESDMARILLLGRLCYCLSLPESGDGFGTRAAHMDAWHAYAEKTFAVSSDVLDSFKPDGTMFHHYMHYGVDYSYVLVNYIVIVQSALKGTPWELSQSAGMVAARSFLGLSMYTSNNHDAVQSVSGRLNSVGAVSTYVSTYALLPELFQEVKNRFGEALWDAVRATTNPPWQGDNRGYYGNPGAIKPWFDAYRNATNNTAKATSGAAMFPYSGLMTFSDTGLGDSAGFIVAAKGYSLFVRNNYEREHNLNNNNVYQSAGSLCVLSRANGAATFGKKGQFYQDGFDWYRMPGVTAPHRDPSECNSGTILRDPRNWPAMEDSAFVGGTAEVGGRVGVWGFHFEDMHEQEILDSTVATKSYIFLRGIRGSREKPSFVLALGSDISVPDSADASKWDGIGTTLFQDSVGAGPIGAAVLDGKQVTSAQVVLLAGDENAAVRLVDTRGIGYVVARHRDVGGGGDNNSTLHVTADTQTSQVDGCKGQTTGKWSTAWIDHGVKPKGAGYEYALLLDAGSATDIAAFDPSAHYTVLSRSAGAHIVRLKDQNTLAAVVFNVSKSLPPSAAPLVSVSAPSTLLFQPTSGGGGAVLTMSNPNLGNRWEPMIPTWTGEHIQMRVRRSKAVDTSIYLSGEWHVVGNAREAAHSLLGPSEWGQGDEPLEFSARAVYDSSKDTTEILTRTSVGAAIEISIGTGKPTPSPPSDISGDGIAAKQSRFYSATLTSVMLYLYLWMMLE